MKKITIEEAKALCEKYGWKQRYGYSKRELGIVTPKRNHKENNKKYFFKLFRKIFRKAI